MERIKGKVAVGMSGGVDSSVAAFLLKKQGYEVVGLFMKLWHDPCGIGENACCDDKALMDARKVADKIGIPFYVVDAREVFKKEIADYFIDEYKNLKTPNPCFYCNKRIKFGWLIDFSNKIGCDFLATGHYARITQEVSSSKYQVASNDQIPNYKNAVIPAEAGIQKLSVGSNQNHGSPGTTFKNTAGPEDDNDAHRLLKGIDNKKDQSYFLAGLSQKQLSSIIFPLGEMTKDETKKIAFDNDLPVYQKKESQEVCFVADDYRKFIKRQLGNDLFKPGDIIDQKRNILGKHNGLVNYTIGQRRGIEQVASKQVSKWASGQRQITSNKQPLYVMGYNLEKNQLVVGEQKELYKDSFEVKDLNFIQASSFKLPASNLTVKIRYQAKEIPCTLSLIQNSKFLIQTKAPALAPTPGQIAVFYNGDEVIASAVIAN